MKQPPDGQVRLGFDLETVEISLDEILPLKSIPDVMRESRKFRQIVSSIGEVGIIEPPVVTRDTESRYILLDGHLRIEALKELGIGKVTCLVSQDDEAFTYNRHVNHISPVQEHKMILRAIERGVPVEAISRALGIEVAGIQRRKNLLDGICPEAAEVLKDKMVATGVFPLLKKMLPFRQIEAAMLMRDARTYSLPYAQALLAATKQEHLVSSAKPKRIKGIPDEQMAGMENEMESLQKDYVVIEEKYGQDQLDLQIAKAYLATLLKNARVGRYLAKNYPEILDGFQRIVDMASLIPPESGSVEAAE